MRTPASNRGERQPHAPIRPGDVVSVGRLAFVVPPPGHGVAAEALLASGGETSARVRTLLDGTVVTRRNDVISVAPPGTPFDKCTDGGYALNSSDWRRMYRWWFRSGSTPKNVRRYEAKTVLRRAVSTITHSRNGCHMSGWINATSTYLGRTHRHSNISPTSTCGSPDGANVVSFGRLDPSDLSLTCWWTVGSHSVEADIVFNKTDYGWTTHWNQGCVESWSIRAVATHEFGHTFGLAHVSPVLHPQQTMSPVILPCQNAQASLGRGDVLGLRARYGIRF